MPIWTGLSRTASFSEADGAYPAKAKPANLKKGKLSIMNKRKRENRVCGYGVFQKGGLGFTSFMDVSFGLWW
jgi:hypothetical protein